VTLTFVLLNFGDVMVSTKGLKLTLRVEVSVGLVKKLKNKINGESIDSLRNDIVVAEDRVVA